MNLKVRLHEWLVLFVKWGVSAVVGFAAQRGIDLDFLHGYETEVAVFLSAVANAVLNRIADPLRKVSWLRPVVDFLWPNPEYQKVPAQSG